MTFIDEIRANRGTFSAVKFDKGTLSQIKNIMGEIKNPVDIKNIHCTIVFSRDKEIPNYPVINHMDIIANVIGFEVWPLDTGKFCLVALLECQELQNRNKKITSEFGIIDRHDTYRPHITLSYDVQKNMNTSKLANRLKTARIISEYFVTQ